MSLVELSNTFILSPAVAIECFGDRLLILHCSRLEFVEINATAHDFLDRLDGESDLSQVAREVAEKFRQPVEVVVRDLQEVAGQLLALEVIEQVEPGDK